MYMTELQQNYKVHKIEVKIKIDFHLNLAKFKERFNIFINIF